jgi:hypothetical protein
MNEAPLASEGDVPMSARPIVLKVVDMLKHAIGEPVIVVRTLGLIITIIVRRSRH